MFLLLLLFECFFFIWEIKKEIHKCVMYRKVYRAKTFQTTVAELFYSVGKGCTVDVGSMISKANVIAIKSNVLLHIYIYIYIYIYQLHIYTYTYIYIHIYFMCDACYVRVCTHISNVARPTSLRITGDANFCRAARSRMLLPRGLLPR